jgi:hypothetical protein
MKKKLIIIAAIALAVLPLAFYLWVPGSVPAGQQPLVKLTPASFPQFMAAFDEHMNLPRVILLLSPT